MEYLKSAYNPFTTNYLRVSGNAPGADGAACAIVCPTEMAHKFRQKPVEIVGIGASCLELMRPHNEMEITKEAGRQVYETTGMTPDDIDLLLVNDFVLPSQLLAAEELGYLPRGEGWKWVLEGRTAFDGDRPINPHGGRTSYGHAFGASGMADVNEAVLQLRGQAGAHQVRNNPKTAMLRGFGGGQNCSIPILRVLD
jgi:acetyl-CoA C-acetyltransferase